MKVCTDVLGHELKKNDVVVSVLDRLVMVCVVLKVDIHSVLARYTDETGTSSKFYLNRFNTVKLSSIKSIKPVSTPVEGDVLLGYGRGGAYFWVGIAERHDGKVCVTYSPEEPGPRYKKGNHYLALTDEAATLYKLSLD